ncbi:precorrin-8X methylmutase [Dissulfurimicrobium hydrothermale]|uniref:precorrin-8X methylmutase n=1 Tax=Dissulfurimicrobium hydrothermale TaxID=1750598 RepID=UPI001EDBF83B|nr:precorrin-8X methylmutase [Dissulfurimicrobium hydrothermale]UKL13066.1 precorrin-8X methylmutase [Dissulfurimicrobium hydrothermale]
MEFELRFSRPDEIEEESFRIIREELGQTPFNQDELSVVIRVVHATGDVSIASQMKFHPKAIQAGIEAVRAGKDVLTDVNMVAAGIDKTRLSRFGGRVMCLIADPGAAKKAQEEGRTRADAAIEIGIDQNDIGIIAIGNAPTALLSAVKYIDRNGCNSLLVGTPVGFVNAAESKELLSSRPYPFITILGRKGGSPAAAAIVNALLRLAECKA